MKKFQEDWRLIYKICSLYYEDDMRQQEISNYLGISRATVSRMLKKGKESGMVKIELVNSMQFSYSKLEKTIERKFRLKDVIIVENSPLDTEVEAWNKLYERSAVYLSEFFSDGDYIGLTMGTTLHNIARTKRVLHKDNQYMFVPIIGGISPAIVNNADVQSNQIAREYAEKFGGSYTQFFAPALFSNKQIKDYFLKEESVNFIFDDFHKLNTLVMGIGSDARNSDTLSQSGYLSEAEMEELEEQGVIGNVAMHFYDKEGNTNAYDGINERVAGMNKEMILRVKNRIGIGGGADRAVAVRGAIKGEFINILITNSECARALLQLDD